VLLGYSANCEKPYSLWNFPPNFGLRKFCFGVSIVETCYRLSSTHVDAQSVINWTVVVQLSWQCLRTPTLDRWSLSRDRQALSTARYSRADLLTTADTYLLYFLFYWNVNSFRHSVFFVSPRRLSFLVRNNHFTEQLCRPIMHRCRYLWQLMRSCGAFWNSAISPSVCPIAQLPRL